MGKQIWILGGVLLILLGACGVNVQIAQPAASSAPELERSAARESATTSVGATTVGVATPTAQMTATPDAPTEQATTSRTELTSTPETTTDEANAPRVLDDKYYVDSDGNAVPDFIEVELGYDPNVDDCATQTCGSAATGASFEQLSNVLLIFDASGSMAASLGSQRKIDAAKAAIARYARVTSQVGSVGLMVYGHKGNNEASGKAESCQGIDILAPLGSVTADTIQPLLDQFQPTGWTPIAGALQKAPEAFAAKASEPKRIILVSDGIETCDGDPVAAARQLYEQQNFNVQVDVVGFDLQNQADVQQMQDIAAAGGGTYYDAKTSDDLDAYFRQQSEAIGQTSEAWTCEIGNISTLILCNQQIVLDAQRYLAKEIDSAEAAGDKAKADAYLELDRRIRESLDTKYKDAEAAGERARQLGKQLEELRRQLRAAYGTP